MPRSNNEAVERAGRLIDENRRIAEGAIIDWLMRTGQWDSEAEVKVRHYLNERYGHPQEQPEAQREGAA